MQVSNEELLHIAKLSDLKINDEELESYRANLEDILNFAEIVNSANVDEDVVKEFEDRDALLVNAPEKERDMFKIPKVIQ